MKKVSKPPANDMRPEYDFSSMKGGVRGKYVKRYQSGTNLVLLDPEVARAFPTDEAVNQALRAVLSLSDALGGTRHGRRRASGIKTEPGRVGSTKSR